MIMEKTGERLLFKGHIFARRCRGVMIEKAEIIIMTQAVQAMSEAASHPRTGDPV